MTRSSATLSLFTEPSVTAWRPSSLALSVVAHAAVAGVAYFALTSLPRIVDPSLSAHYAVRQLDLHAVEQELPADFPRQPALAREKIPYPSPDVLREIAAEPSHDLAEAMRSFLKNTAGRQTLIQPAVRTNLSFSEQVPVPSLMIWTPELAARKKIVAPMPQPLTSAEVPPSLELPNQELKLVDVAAAATPLPARKEAPPAGTTSPIQTHSAKPVQMAPSTVSASLEEPTPTAVLSISDVRMSDGAVFLPPVNDIAKGAGGGHGATASVATGAAEPSRGGAADREEVDDISIDGRRLTMEHIVLPKDGKFSVVVVGGSLSEQYPETPEMWANRMAYTAYLHVGLGKNWIMQYSLTRAAETADAGRVARLEAPWPYDIARPNLLARDLNADALMVHGVLNRDGRLESLAVAFPSNFRYTSFVLRALRQWHFRPARQNGQPTAVEVLLIIPEEMN